MRTPLILIAALLTPLPLGCESSPPDETPSAPQEPTATATATGTPTPTAAPTPTATAHATTDEPTATGAPTRLPPTPSPYPPLPSRGPYDSCDGVDNDDDGATDEDSVPVSFPDLDLDGFGDTDGGICDPTAEAERIPVRGDCDDADPLVHAGAPDLPGDGIDSDCGGTDDADPHVGLETSGERTVAEAMGEARAGHVVWVGPGRWPTIDLEIDLDAITLISTHQALETTLDAEEAGRVMRILPEAAATVDGFEIIDGYRDGGLGSGILVEGGALTLSGSTMTGHAGLSCGTYSSSGPVNGGALAVVAGSLTLKDVDVHDSSISGWGAGIYADEAHIDLVGGTFAHNRATHCAGGAGGAIYANASQLNARGVRFDSNRAVDGGDLYLSDSVALLSGSTLTDSRAVVYTHHEGTFCTSSYSVGGYGGSILLEGPEASLLVEDTSIRSARGTRGGAIYVHGASFSLRRSEVSDSLGERGGAIHAFNTPVSLEDVSLTGNQATEGGGAVYASGGTLGAERVLFAGNQAPQGAALHLQAPTSLSHVTIVENRASEGGAIEVKAPLILSHAILAYNAPANLSDVSQVGALDHTAVYNPPSWRPVEPEPVPSGALMIEPGFVRIRPDLLTLDDDYHLGEASPLRDIGEPRVRDPDGTASDLGYASGPGADFTWYDDRDSDGLFDGWEARQGHDATVPDADLDLDGDGLDGAGELDAGTLAQVGDEDGDGFGDGDEVIGGSDPLDWYNQPGVDGPALATLGEDFATLEEAALAVLWSGVIALPPGTWSAGIEIRAKDVRLQGVGSSSILEGAPEGLRVVNGTLQLAGLRLVPKPGSPYQRGLTATASVVRLVETSVEGWQDGGIAVSASRLLLDDASITGNRAGQGGGLVATDSSLEILRSTLSGNQAYRGGAAALTGSEAWIEESVITANIGLKEGDSYSDCSGYSSDCAVYFPSQGAGLYLSASQVDLFHAVVSDNQGHSGAGIYAEDSTVRGSHLLFSGNDAQTYETPTSYYDCDDIVTVEGTGGALQTIDTDLQLDQWVATGNLGAVTGGVWSDGGALDLTGAILAYNEGHQLYIEGGEGSPCPLSSSALYAAGDDALCNGDGYAASVILIEPGFLAYADALPSDWHLAATSPLIDRLPSVVDPDGSPGDLGLFGGPDGDGWDLDSDGLPTWFWPGPWDAPPEGFEAQEWEDGALWP